MNHENVHELQVHSIIKYAQAANIMNHDNVHKLQISSIIKHAQAANMCNQLTYERELGTNSVHTISCSIDMSQHTA